MNGEVITKTNKEVTDMADVKDSMINEEKLSDVTGGNGIDQLAADYMLYAQVDGAAANKGFFDTISDWLSGCLDFKKRRQKFYEATKHLAERNDN